MLQGSARTWLNSLPAGSINAWVDFEQAFVRNFTGTYKRTGRPSQLAMCVHGPAETGREYLARWTELRNSCEGVHEVQAIQYFVNGCWDGTLLKHKLLCSEPATMAALMVTADKYANTDSAMKIKVALDEAGKAKPIPPPKSAGEGSRQQHNQQNNKRKADQPAQLYDNRLVAAAEQAPATNPAANRRHTGKTTWQPAMSFEEMLDAPCKHHNGARPSTHMLR
nr:uncharacterized protein LOC109768252 [Aegilops tauschii subsp. strangulata]